MRRAFAGALAAVDARRTTATVLRARPIAGPVYLIALGKAALAMSAGALDACTITAGLVIAPRGGPELAMPPGIVVQRGAHPVPDPDVGRRGEALLAWARAIPAAATTLVLLSGGGSALVDAPVDGVTPDDLAAITARLLASGANIEELNALRVSLSRSKGGGLARALGSRSARALVISDVVFGDPSQVASGPMSAWTAPTPADVVARPHVARALTDAERARVRAYRPTEVPNVALELVADNARAVAAAEEALRAEGLRVEAGPALRGEARTCGQTWAEEAASTGADALVSGGETVVTLRGGGRGGRCQETALAALASGIPGTFLCAGTDGIDGPTDAAGALIDADTAARLEPGTIARALAENDAYTALAGARGLLSTGPTGTNVADLAIWARDPAASR